MQVDKAGGGKGAESVKDCKSETKSGRIERVRRARTEEGSMRRERTE